MKSATVRLLLLGAIAALLWSPSALAQRSLGRKRSPTSKLYVSEVSGGSQVVTGEKVYQTRQATAFDAPGTVFETQPNSHVAVVLSNGTGLYLDASTRVQIDKLDQDNFRADSSGLESEPSVSQTSISLIRGLLAISTSRMSSGSSMVYTTPQGTVNVRGRSVAIEANDESTVVYLLDGDVTVRTNGPNPLSRVLNPGEQATIWPGPPPAIIVAQIPEAKRSLLGGLLQVAANTRQTVTFETIAQKSLAGAGGPAGSSPAQGTASGGSAASGNESAGAGFDSSSEVQIVARPTVPTTVPANIVVSPDRLPGKG